MNKTSSWTNYEQCLMRVNEYIYDHLDDQLDLYRLADIACLSPYHWHRIYHAVYGETIAAAVKRLRLQRAAEYLAQNTLSIKEIARRSGYRNVQSFTRIFGSVHGMPPAQYRRSGSHTQFQPQHREGTPGIYDVVVEAIPSMNAVAIAHTGSYVKIGKAFDTLYGWLVTHGLIRPAMRSIGVFYDDPDAVSVESLRSRACVVVDEGFPIASPLVAMEIAGGSYAVLRHKGPYANMRAAYQWLYGYWLLQSGRAPANEPVFEEYLNSPRDIAPTDLLTQIYLPLT